MGRVISQDLSLNVRQLFCTDSISLICYISNDTAKYNTFVANTVSEIRDCTEIDQYRYVESETNPAAIAFR